MKRLLILLIILGLFFPAITEAKKWSELTALTTVATGDILAVIDVSATPDETKQITWGELMAAPGAIGGTTPDVADFTSVATTPTSAPGISAVDSDTTDPDDIGKMYWNASHTGTGVEIGDIYFQAKGAQGSAGDLETAFWYDSSAQSLITLGLIKVGTDAGTGQVNITPASAIDGLYINMGTNSANGIEVTGADTNDTALVFIDQNETDNATAYGLHVDSENTTGPAVLIESAYSVGLQLDSAIDMGTQLIINVADATNLGDAINLRTLLNTFGITLNYWLSNQILTTTLTDSEASLQETPSSDPETLTTITFKSTVLDTPTPFEMEAGDIVEIHFSADVTSVSGKHDETLIFQFGYVDADGTSNFVQIGSNSDPTAVLTEAKTVYESHIHVAVDTAVPAGKRLWLKVIADVTATSGSYPEINFYYDDPSHHISFGVSGDILGNFLQLSGGNMTGELQSTANITPGSEDITCASDVCTEDITKGFHFIISEDDEVDADALTLDNGTVNGQTSTFVFKTETNAGDTIVIDTAQQVGWSAFTMAEVGDSVTFVWDGTNWTIESDYQAGTY